MNIGSYSSLVAIILDKLGVSPWGRYLVLAQVVKSRIYANCSPVNISIGSMHAKKL